MNCFESDRHFMKKRKPAKTGFAGFKNYYLSRN